METEDAQSRLENQREKVLGHERFQRSFSETVVVVHSDFEKGMVVAVLVVETPS